jgi:hypothetical protein
VNANALGVPEVTMNKNDRAYTRLRTEQWSARLIQAIDAAGGVRKAPAGLLFELRFGYEAGLQCPDATIGYEFDAKIGGSTIDFFVPHGGFNWLIELVSLDDSKAIRQMRAASRTTVSPGIQEETIALSSDADSPHDTPAAELIRVGEKLQEKVWDRTLKKPRKFPKPQVGWVHVLIINMAGFEGMGFPDGAHCHEVVFGSKAVAAEWRSDPDAKIVGLFDPENSHPGAVALQERIDLVGFVAEDPGAEGDDDEIRRTIYFLGNPNLNGACLVRSFPVLLANGERDPLHRLRDA